MVAADVVGCSGIADRFQSLSCLETAAAKQQLDQRQENQFQSLTNFKSDSKILQRREAAGTGRRSRPQPPMMGTSRLGTPPLQHRFLTPPRSLERNKISTVFLPSSAKSSTPKAAAAAAAADVETSSPTQLFDESFTAVSAKSGGEFLVKRTNPFRGDLLRLGGVSKHQMETNHVNNNNHYQRHSAATLPRDHKITLPTSSAAAGGDFSSRSARAGSCSSQESSGVSSGISSSASSGRRDNNLLGRCDCPALVTVNGQHHCSGSTVAAFPLASAANTLPTKLYSGSSSSAAAAAAVLSQSLTACDHQSCEDTLSTCSDCDSNLIIVHV